MNETQDTQNQIELMLLNLETLKNSFLRLQFQNRENLNCILDQTKMNCGNV